MLTQFAADGEQIIGVPRRQPLVLDKGKFRTPRSVNWNVELDREWMKNFFVRVGYQQREGRREYLLDPVEDPALSPMLRLSPGGHSRYKGRTWQMREILEDIRAHYPPETPVIVAGDFNTRKGVDSPVLTALRADGFQDALQDGKGPPRTKVGSNKKLDWIFVRHLIFPMRA